jgi:tetratricopeptide (TPR) repeat protein
MIKTTMQKYIYLFPILLLAVVLAIVNTGCSAKLKKAYHLQKANQFFAAGQYDQAEIEYINVLRSDHENAEAIIRLGDIYFEEGRVQKAAPFIIKGGELETNNLDLHLKLGIIYLTVGKLKEAHGEANFVLDQKSDDAQAPLLLIESVTTPKALEEAKQRLQALSQKADNASLEVALGDISLRAGDLKAAESAFKRAQTLDPKSSAAWSALGALYLVQTNTAEADAALKKAAELAPDRSQEKLQYAEFKFQTGDPAASQRILGEMVQKTPDYIPAWMASAKVAAAGKKYDDCAALLAKLLARDPDNFEALLLNAQVELAQDKTVGATLALERMAKNYPQAPPVHYQLAVAYVTSGNDDQAIPSLQKAVALNTNYFDAILLLAELQIKAGDVDSAIAALKQLTQSHPQISQAQLLLAAADRARNNFADALGIYRQLETEYPKNAQIPLLMGATFLQQTNNGEARKAFTRALELAPDNFTVVEQLVDLDLMEKQYAAALALVQPQLENFPRLAAPHILEAQIFMAQDDSPHAEASLMKAVELQPEGETAHMLLARLYMGAKQNQKALAELQVAAMKNTNDVAPLLMIGIIHNDAQEYPAARDAYEKLLVMNPKFTPALNNLAYIYSEFLSNPDRAYELAQTARKLLPNDPSAADTLGWILCKRGQYASALALIQSSAAQLPDEPEIQFHLAKTLYLMGQESPARQAFQYALQSGRDFRGKDECNQCLAILAVDPKTAGAAVRADLEKRVAAQPDDLIALIRLGAIYQRDGTTGKAIVTYESALKADPNNLTVLISLAQLYSANKNTPQALESAKSAYALAPDNSEVSHILGRLAYETGDYKLSVNLLREVARNQPGDSQAQFDFAEAAYAMGQVPDAQTAMRSVLQIGNEFSGANEAKRFLNLTTLVGNPSQAAISAAQVEEILKSEPNYVPALMAQAVLNEQKNDVVAARQGYEKVLGLYPNFAPAQKCVAILAAENPGKGNDPQAYDYATKARAAFPVDPEVAKALGIILYRQGDFTRAEKLLMESAAQRNSDSEVFYYLGMAEYQLKKMPECKKNLQQALTLNLPDAFSQETKRVLAELK